MDITTFMALFGATAVLGKTGQEVWSIPGTYDFIVPPNTTILSAALVSGGGGGGRGQGNIGTASAAQGGRGGDLRWVRNLPVTPGEVLTVVVGAGGVASASAGPTTGASTIIRRGTTNILVAGAFVSTAIGTKPDGSVVGGGDGGAGGSTSGNGEQGGGGGGAGGYAGNGGTYTGATFTPATGGAGGGGAFGGQGGNVGLYGQGSNGTSGVIGGNPNGGLGSGPALYTAGGGGYGGNTGEFAFERAGSAGAAGGARIIWGENRFYPSTRTADE